MYLQFSCDYSSEMDKVLQTGLLVGFITVIACFVFAFGVYYAQCEMKINFSVSNHSTATVGDFSVKVLIPREVWD